MTGQEAVAHRQARHASQRLIADLRSRRISRRDFVVRAAGLGFSGAAIHAFLVACSVGGATATNTPIGSPAPSAAGATATGQPATASATTGASATAGVGATAVTGGGTATVPARPAPSQPGATPGTPGTPGTGPAQATPGTPVATPVATAQGTLIGGAVPTNAPLADQQVLKYPFQELNYADPGLMTSVLEVQFALACWDGLVTANQLGEPQPAHATKFDISADGKKYTFTLRPGLKWSDGSPLTARDYEWTWKRNLDPVLASEYAQALYPIKGAAEYNTGKVPDSNGVAVKATGDTTLEVELTAAAPYFLALASTWTYYPLQRAAIEKHKEKWVEAGNMVTAGRFKLQSWEHEKQMVLVADANYYGEKPSLTQITLVLYNDLAGASLPAYEKGEIDVVTTLSPENLQRVKNDSRLRQELNLLPVSGTAFIVFDLSNAKSPVAKKEFRQAVYHAINRDRLANDVLKGQFAPTATFAPKGILGHLDQPPTPVNLKGDLAKAKQLLQAAGYQGEELVYTHSDQARAKTIAQAIQQDLKDAGIAVRLEQLAGRAYSSWRDTRQDQPFDLYVGGWFSDYEDPNSWYNFLFANPAEDYWHTHYAAQPGGKQFVDLITAANAEADRKKREDLYLQAERRLLDDLPFVPFYNNQDVVMVKPYVKGLVHTNVGHDLFGGVKLLRR